MDLKYHKKLLSSKLQTYNFTTCIRGLVPRLSELPVTDTMWYVKGSDM